MNVLVLHVSNGSFQQPVRVVLSTETQIAYASVLMEFFNQELHFDVGCEVTTFVPQIATFERQIGNILLSEFSDFLNARTIH
jgi:hypothetical protein